MTQAATARLSPSQTQQGLRLSVIEGLLSNIHVSITTGAFLTGYALLLGAGALELGVIGALPFVSQMFQFVGAYLEESTGRRRFLTVLSSGLSRGLWIIAAVLPFANLPAAASMGLFLLMLIISQALIGITANTWTSWMTDLVPALLWLPEHHRQRDRDCRHMGRRRNPRHLPHPPPGRRGLRDHLWRRRDLCPRGRGCADQAARAANAGPCAPEAL
jgi:hypothetical protein